MSGVLRFVSISSELEAKFLDLAAGGEACGTNTPIIARMNVRGIEILRSHF